MANKVLLLSLLNSVHQKCYHYVSFVQILSVSVSYFDKPAPIARRGESKIAAYHRPSNMQLSFAGGPIVVSFNVLSET